MLRALEVGNTKTTDAGVTQLQKDFPMTTTEPATTPKPRRCWLQFSLQTMLIAVAWSSTVFWLNIKPHTVDISPQQFTYGYGLPWLCDERYLYGVPLDSSPWRHQRITTIGFHHRAFAGNVAIGILAVAVLTFVSKFLLSRIMSMFKFGKTKEEHFPARRKC